MTLQPTYQAYGIQLGILKARIGSRRLSEITSIQHAPNLQLYLHQGRLQLHLALNILPQRLLDRNLANEIDRIPGFQFVQHGLLLGPPDRFLFHGLLLFHVGDSLSFLPLSLLLSPNPLLPFLFVPVAIILHTVQFTIVAMTIIMKLKITMIVVINAAIIIVVVIIIIIIIILVVIAVVVAVIIIV